MTGNRPRYLDTKQAAAYLGNISPSTLNRMRVSGDGPRFVKARQRVIYDVKDLDEWAEKRKRRFTGESDEDRDEEDEGGEDEEDQEDD